MTNPLTNTIPRYITQGRGYDWLYAVCCVVAAILCTNCLLTVYTS